MLRREWYCIIGNKNNYENGLAYMETIYGKLVYAGAWLSLMGHKLCAFVRLA